MKLCKFNDVKKAIKSLISEEYKDVLKEEPTSSILDYIITEAVELNHVNVSEDEKIKLLTYIKDLTSSEDYSENVKNLVDLIISGMNTNTLSGVQTPDKCNGKDLNFFDVAVEKDKAFVQGVNEVLSATIRLDIIVKLKSKLLFVGNSESERISINSEEINKELIALKKKELKNLIDWLYREKGYKITVLPSEDFIMDTSNPIKERYSAYQKLMASVAKELYKYIDNAHGKVKERISEATRKNFINPLESFLLLLNFDNFVEYFIGEDINIAPKFRGDFLNQDSKKYTIKSDSYFEHSFQDDLTLDNGAHTTPHIVKLFFGTILTGGENTEFLSNLDHRQVVSVINHMRTNEHISQELLGYLNTLFTSRDYEKEYAALINILNSKEFRSKYKESKLKALVAAIERYYKAVKNTEPLLTIEELEYFNRHRNVISALIHSIQSLKAAVFVATTENGNTINTAVERSTSKKLVYDAIKAEARKNYKSGNDVFVYSSVFSVSGGRSALQITDLYSDAAMQMIRKILGQSISDDVLETLDPNLVGDALTSVQKLYNRYVSPYSSLQDDLLEAALNNFIKALQRDLSMKVFTDKLVEKETAQLLKIYSQEMNTLPSENIVSILTDSERNIEEYQEHFKELGIPNKNIILKEELHKMREFMRIQSDKDKFVSHNCFRSDVKIVDEGNKSKVISHTLLEPSELATVALNYDWIQSLVDGNVFFLLTETYSDKPRVLIHQYNFAEKLSTKQDPFYVKSTSALRLLHFELLNAYYAAIENDIVNRWNALAPYLGVDPFIDIESILEYLSKGLSYADFKAAIIKYQLDPKNKPINFIDHYDHLNNNGIVTMNGALLYKIKVSRDPELFNKDLDYGFNKFLESLKSNGNVLVKLSQIEDDDKLLKILGLTIELLSDEDKKELQELNKGKTLSEEQINEILKASLAKIKSSKTWNPDHADKVNDLVIVAGKNLYGWKTSDLFKKVLKKYHATQALLQDADLQMGIKYPWLHIPKKVQYKDAATLYKMLEADDKEDDTLIDIRNHEYSQRLVAGKKRNSSGVTTFTPLKLGMRFGVPDLMKVIMATFPTLIVENHIGIKDKGLKPHDGASVVLGIYSLFEENSYPNHDYLGTRKTIGLIPHFGSFTLVKHAENTLTNELLRGMAHRSVEYEFNPDNLIRIGYEGCKLTDKFIHNFANLENRKEFESDGVFYNFNGSIARLTNIECDEATKSFKFTWTYIEGEDLEGTEVNLSLVNQMIGLPSDANGFVKIENLLLLYKAFGSYNSMSYNEYGNIVPSEISNIVCARLISYYDVDPKKYFNDTTYVENLENAQIDMKKSMVAKIIDPESCKSGQIAVNSAKDLSEGNVAYGYLDTSRWGIQLDYTHETTDAKIPALTLVITAIAFNGNNVELVANLYESLGKIISDSLRPILTMNGDSQLVNYYLGKKLIKSLLKNSVASNALEIVKNFLDDLMAEMSDSKLAEDRMSNGELPITLCISNSDLFYKVTSDLVANLNRDTIKQEFDGIAVIQCPSQGIVMMYEDHNGQMYKRSDVVRRALLLLKLKSKEGVLIISFIDKNTKELVVKDLNTALLSEEDLLNWYFSTEEGNDLFGDVVIDKYNIDSLNIGDHIVVREKVVDPITNEESYIEYVYLSRDTLNLETKKENDILKFKNIDPVLGEKWINIKELNNYKNPVRKNVRNLIDTPEDLRYIYSLVLNNPNITIIKKFSEERDLGVTKITWTEEDGSKSNLFCIESTILLAATRGKNKLIKAWHRANLKGLGSENPYYYKTLEAFKSDDPSLRTYIKNLNHKAGQLIIPKKYSLFEEKDYSLDEIRSNPNFFVDLARKRYTLSTQLDNNKLFGIATSFGEIIFENSAILENEINTETIKDGNSYYITDKVGNRLLEVPGLNYKGILTTNEDGKKVMTVKVSGYSSNQNFEDFVERARKVLDRKGLVNAYYYYNANTNTTEVNYKVSKFRVNKSIEENIQYIANGLCQSWNLSHITISTRIPSQSFQSFLWTETVGYTDTTDYNLGYMNIWEMWFQGSK